MSYTTVIIRDTNGTVLEQRLVRETEYKRFLREVYRTYKVVEEIATYAQIFVVEC